MKTVQSTGYQGFLELKINNGKIITTKVYKNSGTKALGTLVTSCLVGNSLPRTAYPTYMDIQINNVSCFVNKRGISSPYIVEPTDAEVSGGLIGSAKYSALIRSIDIVDFPEGNDGVIQLLDGSEEPQVLAEIQAPGIGLLLRTIRNDVTYNATLEWTLQLVNI